MRPGGGFCCPKCGGRTSVKDSGSRQIKDGLNRRRVCLSCKYRFTTFELTEERIAALTKIKNAAYVMLAAIKELEK